jgi:FkbM family methyltransferase
MLDRVVYIAAAFLEKYSGAIRGKGFGSFSIGQEVAASFKAIGHAPQLVIDVGGNIGQYALAVRSRAPEADVHVFEPSATNVALLAATFAGDEKVTVVPIALSDRAGVSKLFADHPGSGLGSLTRRRLHHFDVEMNHFEDVELMTLDHYWSGVLGGRTIDLLKIDVEGHELAVLRGAQRALEKTSVIQLEFGGCNIDTRTFFQDLYYYLTPLGFRIFRITPIGVESIQSYTEDCECFKTTNFIAVRQ